MSFISQTTPPSFHTSTSSPSLEAHWEDRHVQIHSIKASFKTLPRDIFQHLFCFLNIEKTLTSRSVCQEWNQHWIHPKNFHLLLLTQADCLGASLYFLRKYPEMIQSMEKSKSETSSLPSSREIVQRRILAHARKHGADEKQVEESLQKMKFSCIKEKKGKPSLFSFIRRKKKCPSFFLIGFHEFSVELPQSHNAFSHQLETTSISLIGWAQTKNITGDFGPHYNQKGSIIYHKGKPLYLQQNGNETFSDGGMQQGSFGLFFDLQDNLITRANGTPIYGLKEGKEIYPNRITKQGSFGFFFDPKGRLITQANREPIYGLKTGTRTFPSGALLEGTFGFCFDANGNLIRNEQGGPALTLQKGIITLPDGNRFQGPFPVFFEPNTGDILEFEA